METMKLDHVKELQVSFLIVRRLATRPKDLKQKNIKKVVGAKPFLLLSPLFKS